MTSGVDNLWAPWRLEYIKTTVLQPEQECFLCEAVSDDKDRERLVLHRGKATFVIINLYPYNNGHLLVAPNRHLSTIDELKSEEMVELFDFTRRAVRWVKRAFNPHGYNIGMNIGRVAGAGVPDHLHMHIVPRWNGDTNFMPVLGGTKVISEGLQSTYDRLKEAIREVEGDGSA